MSLIRIIIFICIIMEYSMANLPKYHIKTLSNGLEVVAIPLDNKSNVISVDIFYKVGSVDEVMGKSGIAHMLEHLNFKSTKNLKAGEFDEIVKGFGGVNNAGTSFDYTHYFIKCSSKNIDKSLKLFAELMANLNLKKSEFQTEREVVLQERLWRTDNSPMGYMYFKLFNNTFIYHPYHWTPIGFIDDIKHWKLKDIKQFHKKYYNPNNAIIVVSGDILKDKVFRSVEKYFNAIKPYKDTKQVLHTIEPKQDGAKHIILHKNTQTQMLALAYRIPDFKSKDQIALSALSQILSSQKSGRLYKRLIKEKNMVNTIFGYNMENIYPSLFLFVAVCNQNIKAKNVLKEILKEIDNIKNGNITQKELDIIKINTTSDFIHSLEQASNISDMFGSYLARGDLKPLLTYEQDIKNLTIKDITNVAKKYFTKNNSTTIILKSNIKKGIKK